MEIGTALFWIFFLFAAFAIALAVIFLHYVKKIVRFATAPITGRTKK